MTEEIGKRRLVIAGAIAAGLAYFLVCAFPVQKELVLVPRWSKSVSSAPSLPAGATKAETATGANAPIPFRLGGRYGYFRPDGTVLFAADAAYGVAMAADAFAPYDRLSESFTIQSPEGAELAKVTGAGYPFFAAGRRFIVGPDQSTVSELDSKGHVRWSYQFPSIITAFDASQAMAAFGLMDGSIVGLGPEGTVALDFTPGGSRIDGVYGVAVSPDAQLVAAMTGVDRQRLVVLERRSAAFRVTYHRYLASDYRRPVHMSFTADGTHLLYESPAGVGVYDRGSRSESVVTVSSNYRLGLTMREGQLMVFLSGKGLKKRLVCTGLPDRRVLDVPITAALAFVHAAGDSIYLGTDDAIVRMDLQAQ